MEKFNLRKPSFSQLDIAQIQQYCDTMEYTLEINEFKAVISNETKDRWAFIQNHKDNQLSVIYGTDKVNLTSLIITAYWLEVFISKMINKGITMDIIKTSSYYESMRSICEIDFFKKYKDKNEKRTFIQIDMRINYKIEKEIIFNKIMDSYPHARLLFRQTPAGIALFCENIPLEAIEECLKPIKNDGFKIQPISDKEIYNALRYGKQTTSKKGIGIRANATA